MKKKVLLISQLISKGPTPKIQRDFWGEMANEVDLVVLCEPGECEVDFPCRLEPIEKKHWVKPFFKILSGIGLPDVSHIPDIGIYDWLPQAFNQALRICQEERFDYIYSISWPQSNHLLAYKIKKAKKIPWVACFYDPWIEHVAQKFNLSFFKKVDIKREGIVASNADLIIHSNQKIYTNWSKRYGISITNKIKILPFCYNINELPSLKYTRKIGEKLYIMHIGGVYGSRSSNDLVCALEHLKVVNPELSEQIEVTFVGATTEKERIQNNSNVGHLFKFVDYQPLNALDSFYAKASVFLLLDMNINECPFFPSKLMMYEYYQKPILCITTRGSVCESELTGAGYPVFYYGEEGALEDYLVSLIKNYDQQMCFDKDTWKKYDVKNVVKDYNMTVDKVLLRK